MKKIKTFFKNLNYRHYICSAITMGFILLSVFGFPYAFPRIAEGCRDIGNSAVYYISELFELNLKTNVTVTELSKLPFELTSNMPNTWNEFALLAVKYFKTIADKQNISNYFGRMSDLLVNLCYILLYVMPVVLAFVLVKMLFPPKTNNDYNVDTTALKLWKRACKRVYAPIKSWCCEFVAFVKKHSVYWKLWLLTWAYNFNLIAIVLETIAFYLYFVVSMNVGNLYVQVLKLLADLSVVIHTVPIVVWIIIAYLILDVVRKKIGYGRLNRYERRNRGFINERPILTLVVGTMGKKKTTLITDMALSQEIMFRDVAFQKILEQDLKFPYFPWINLENSLKQAIERHSVYNLATSKRFIHSKKKKYERNLRKHRPLAYNNLFGYDVDRYGFYYNNGLEIVDLWSVLETYAQLYFIYIMECSLIVSNYSVRTDNVLQSVGNFPLWNTELFKRDTRLMDAYSRHSHILDFDALRLGKKVVENNKYANVFEFGVVTITEIGKERGNKIELDGKKKMDETANQKNDLFNSWLKMCRHSATVDNFPFIKVISDEQRASSWGADAVELCEIVYIKESGEKSLAMPFFALEGMFADWEVGTFENKYTDYRYRRGDNTLPMYLWKGLSSKIKDFATRIENTFGYCRIRVQIEDGARDGKRAKKKYYLMSKKIYSRRFATDCYSDFYAQKALDSLVGLEELPEYKSVKATVDEFLKQNSYFMADLLIGLLRKGR
ncbi:MAG: hypothetical protein NC548_61535 [Lachnospiraceae bacterium]|nr:hypothetical protein [Lachnospiraceae bacterium]